MAERRRFDILAHRRGFTLIELLVVISVIGLMVALLTVGGTHVMRQQRANYTTNIMRATSMALDQFAEVDPLGSVYNRRNKATFGTVPPYPLRDDGSNTVADVLAPQHPILKRRPNSLAEQLAADLSGQANPTVRDWANLASTDREVMFDDNRALYIYLKLYVPDALAGVPEDVIKPLPKGPRTLDVAADPEYVDRTGKADVDTAESRENVFGIYDAWGVPLEYYVHVKLEYGLPPGGTTAGWYVAQRVPVLRSRGVRAEVFEVAHESGTPGATDPAACMYSVEFPSPAAMSVSGGGFKSDGQLSGSDARDNGWARAVAASQKPEPDADAEDVGSAFGYVP